MKEKPIFVSLVLALAVMVLAVIEAKFAWSFWGSLAGEDSAHAIEFRLMGVTIAIVELILLTVATNGARRGYAFIAYCARIVFIPVVIVNFIVGASAITTLLANDVQQRQDDVARYEHAAVSVEETKERTASLHDSLAQKNLDLPPQALKEMVSGMEGLIRESGHTPWRAQRLAELKAAFATAEEVARLEGEARAVNSGRLGGVRPAEVSPYLGWLITVAGWMGITLEPEQVRDQLTMLLAVTLRLLLSFGWWIALAPYSGTRERNDDPPRFKSANDDFRKRALATWHWPKPWTAPLRPVPVTSGFDPGGSGGGQSGSGGPMQASPPPMQSMDLGRTGPKQPVPTSDHSADGAPEKQSRGTKPRQRPSPRKPTARSSRDSDDPLDDLDPV